MGTELKVGDKVLVEALVIGLPYHPRETATVRLRFSAPNRPVDVTVGQEVVSQKVTAAEGIFVGDLIEYDGAPSPLEVMGFHPELGLVLAVSSHVVSGGMKAIPLDVAFKVDKPQNYQSVGDRLAHWAETPSMVLKA